MPTMSQDTVKTLPMCSRSTMSLEEIREEMLQIKPDLEEFAGGWASINNEQSCLGLAGVTPPESAPVIRPETDLLPQMLMARFYYWEPLQTGLNDRPELDPHSFRRLTAIDVMITKPSEDLVGLLFSTRNRQSLSRRKGILTSLTAILQRKDHSVKIDRMESFLKLKDEEIFLWLTVQNRDAPQLTSNISLDKIQGISSCDISRRTAELKAGVDFERANFLTAVAEKDTLGPMDLCLVERLEEENYSYEMVLHIDGGFEIRKRNLHFPDSLDRPELMLETSLYLAYRLIPDINHLYSVSAPAWSQVRDSVIQEAMETLENRYKSLQGLLQKSIAAAV